MFKNRKRKGFTLIELVIVIAIIGILAAIAIPRFTASTEKAQNTKISANARTLASALSTFFAEKGKWPADKATGIQLPIGVNNAQKDATEIEKVLYDAGLWNKGYTFTTTDNVIKVVYTWGVDLPKYTGENSDGVKVEDDKVTFTF